MIKRGGMAEVYEAVSEQSGRRVALKKLLHNRGEADVAAFADEARIASQLDHSSIVPVLDYGAVDGQPFQVLELVDGYDLRELVQLGRRKECPPPIEVGLMVGACIGRALEYAHHAKDDDGRPLDIVHRDVTPHNILVSWAAEIRLADFGIAMSARRAAVTEPGFVKGKLSFMAPEYLANRRVSPQIDVFGLGCVLHFIFTGKSPFFSEKARADAARGVMPALLEGVPEALAEIIMWACHPSPTHRCASALELAQACESTLERRSGPAAESVLREWLQQLRPAPPIVDKARLAEVFVVAPTGLDTKTGVARFRTMPMQPSTQLVDPPPPSAVFADPALATVPSSPETSMATGVAAAETADKAGEATISVPASRDELLDVDFGAYEPIEPLRDDGR
ncbi:MAG: serine/threonine-protein kinase, partial [Myxococcota bacterium]